MAATGGRVVRIGRALVRFTESPVSEPVVFAIALGVYAAVSIALPLQAGRDLPRYLLDYAQLFDSHVVYPYAILSRTPGTGLVSGVLLELGPIVSEVGVAALYALSIAAWFSVSRRFGPVAALTTAAALLAYPGYVLLFHELASDALFAAAFALVAVLLMRVAEAPTAGRAAALGLGVALLVFVRPVGQVLLVLGLVPLLAARGRRPRLIAAGAFAVGALCLSSPSRRTTPRGRTTSPSSAAGRRRSSSGRSSRIASSSRETGRPPRSSRAPSRGSSSPTSPTARAGSTSRRSSRRAALACTTTSPCCPTGRGAGTTTTATSVASPVRRSARIPARTHGASRRISGGCCSGPCTRRSRGCGPAVDGRLGARAGRRRERGSGSGRRPTTASRSLPRASRPRSRPPTGGSGRCGHRRPSTGSSSATPRIASRRPRSIDR